MHSADHNGMPRFVSSSARRGKPRTQKHLRFIISYTLRQLALIYTFTYK